MLVGENCSPCRNPKTSWKNNEHHKLDLDLTGIAASNSVSCSLFCTPLNCKSAAWEKVSVTHPSNLSKQKL